MIITSLSLFAAARAVRGRAEHAGADSARGPQGLGGGGIMPVVQTVISDG
jgi:MFS family permease